MTISMKINFTPQWNNEPELKLNKKGGILEIVGFDKIDLSDIPSGGMVEDGSEVHKIFASGFPIIRTEDVISFTVILPHGFITSQNVLFPEEILVEKDGPIPVPLNELEIE